MALVTCPDCTSQVSDSAPACPKCGRPLGGMAREASAIGVPLTTTQGTSKRLKSHILVASVLFWGGILTMCSHVSSHAPGQPQSGGIALVATLAMLAGLVWYIVTKARIWWHHK